MKYYLWLLILTTILISCSEDNIINPCGQFITVKTQEELIIELGYKYKLVYNTKYIDGEIYGDPKKLTMTVFFNEFGKDDSTVNWHQNGTIEKSIKSIYDSRNNFLGQIIYCIDSPPRTLILFEYFYNELGLITRKNELEEGLIKYYTTYLYDKENRIIEEAEFDENDEILIKRKILYGDCTKPRFIDLYYKNEYLGRSELVYDRFGNILGSYDNNGCDGKRKFNITSYRYDDMGREISFLQESGEPWVEFTYNSEGLKNSLKNYNHITGVYSLVLDEYEYYK